MVAKQMPSATRGRGLPFRQVQVVEINSDQGVAICYDPQGVLVHVPMKIRRSKGGWPAVGETWMITREFGIWTFAAIVESAAPPILTSSPTGAHPLLVELVEALAAMGIIDYQPEPDTGTSI